MKYKCIIQELKESNDPNLLAFVKDLEKMKQLSKKERDYCLQTRFLSGSVKKLVEDYIPYIVFVAYFYSEKTKTLQLLDLINEGILGVYVAFEKSTKDGVLTRQRVNNTIKWAIKKAIFKDSCQNMSEYSFDTMMPEDSDEDEENIMDIDRGNVKSILLDVLKRNFGDRDAGIIYDYYWGKVETVTELSNKYGLTDSRCRQVIKQVNNLNYTTIKNLKIYL